MKALRISRGFLLQDFVLLSVLVASWQGAFSHEATKSRVPQRNADGILRNFNLQKNLDDVKICAVNEVLVSARVCRPRQRR